MDPVLKLMPRDYRLNESQEFNLHGIAERDLTPEFNLVLHSEFTFFYN